MTREITRYIASFWMVLRDVFGYCLVDSIASICVSLFALRPQLKLMKEEGGWGQIDIQPFLCKQTSDDHISK